MNLMYASLHQVAFLRELEAEHGNFVPAIRQLHVSDEDLGEISLGLLHRDDHLRDERHSRLLRGVEMHVRLILPSGNTTRVCNLHVYPRDIVVVTEVVTKQVEHLAALVGIPNRYVTRCLHPQIHVGVDVLPEHLHHDVSLWLLALLVLLTGDLVHVREHENHHRQEHEQQHRDEVERRNGVTSLLLTKHGVHVARGWSTPSPAYA